MRSSVIAGGVLGSVVVLVTLLDGCGNEFGAACVDECTSDASIDTGSADGAGGDVTTAEGGGGEGGGGDGGADGDAMQSGDSRADGADGFDGFTCDVTKAPKDDGCVLSPLVHTGIFVATYGLAGADGTAAAPVDTINTALVKAKAAGLHRVYVCGGTYAGNTGVSINGTAVNFDVQIFGGLTCPGASGDAGAPWTYTAAATTVAPTTAGYALAITNVTNVVGISDIEFDAISASGQDATGAGNSSIAAFVTGSSNVTFTRATLKAGDGSNGQDGTAPVTNHNTGVMSGNGTITTTGAQRLTCMCPVSGTTSGGYGGVGDTMAAGTGADGTPALRLGYGAGGIGGKINPVPMTPPPYLPCQPGVAGDNGVGGAAGSGATTNGTISAGAWTPTAGTSGGVGGVGQGGGGAGGSASASGGLGGTGGACGGCGGGSGLAGKGGGSSFALVAFTSSVKLNASKLVSGLAGNGGSGGAGENGQAGGAGGTMGACTGGGDGGNGAGGGGGGGGAGGLSLGIAWTGTAPTVDGTMQMDAPTLAGVWTPGTAGVGGTHGAGGAAVGTGNAGAPGTDGIAGFANAVKHF